MSRLNYEIKHDSDGDVEKYMFQESVLLLNYSNKVNRQSCCSHIHVCTAPPVSSCVGMFHVPSGIIHDRYV